MKGGAVLLVAVVLFRVSGLTETAAPPDSCKDCEVGEQLEQMNTQMNEMKETLSRLKMLQEVILALKEPIENQFNVCLSHTLGIENCELGTVDCSSIDLTMERAHCVECVKHVCPSYGNLTRKIAIKNEGGDLSIDSETKNNYDLEIDESGKVTCKLWPIGKNLRPSDCSCSWLHYYSTDNHTFEGNSSAPLKCDCNDTEGFFCHNNACYNSSCSVIRDSKVLQCKMHELSNVKKNIKVDFSETPYACLPDICEVNLQLAYNDIVVKAGNYYPILNRKLNETVITCEEAAAEDAKKKLICNGTLHDNCSNIYSLIDCSKIKPVDVGGHNDTVTESDKSTSYALYVAIIVVILILFALYVGYQNYQKISECVNGVESEGSQAHSNRRGRMKGKYAPLPRVMEESVTRHND